MKVCTKPLLWKANYHRENNSYRTLYIYVVLNRAIWMNRCYIILFHILGTFYLSKFFPASITLINYATKRHKSDKIGPSHLLSDHGDLSFVLFFFETVLGREHSGKVSKKFISNFWGITLNSQNWTEDIGFYSTPLKFSVLAESNTLTAVKIERHCQRYISTQNTFGPKIANYFIPFFLGFLSFTFIDVLII